MKRKIRLNEEMETYSFDKTRMLFEGVEIILSNTFP